PVRFGPRPERSQADGAGALRRRDGLPGNERESGKPALAGHPMRAGEEALETLEVRLALPSQERIPMCRPCIVPPTGDLSGVLGDVEHPYQIEAGVTDDTLVLAGGEEQ